MQHQSSQHQHARPLSTATMKHPGQIRDAKSLARHLHNTGGKHFPLWVSHEALPHVAHLIQSGHAIPHPGVPMPMPDPQQAPQGYERGGVIAPPNPIQNDFGNGQPPIANHPGPQFLGPPIRPPQQIDAGAVGMVNPPQGLGGLSVGANAAPPQATGGLANVSVPIANTSVQPGAVQQSPQAATTGGGPNPIQNDFNSTANSEVPIVKGPFNSRRMKSGGVVKKKDNKKGKK